MMSMPSGQTLACLRRETSPQHRRVEALLDLGGRCVRSGATGYAAALAALYGIHAALEDRLNRAMVDQPPIDDWERRRGKPGWLAADLGRLGVVAATELAVAPTPASLPTLSDRAAILGCLYVVEGSMLGGAAAARQVRSVLGDEVPFRFFRGYGADTAAMWRSLSLDLQRWGTRHDGLGRIVTTAKLTFGAFESHILHEFSTGRSSDDRPH